MHTHKNCSCKPTVMILSFRTDRSRQTVQTQIRLLLGAVWSGSSLFAIPFASFGQNILWFGLFVWILGSLQQSFLVCENLGTLRYSNEHPHHSYLLPNNEQKCLMTIVNHYTNMPLQHTAIVQGCENGNFQMKKCGNFLIFALNIDCGYTLEQLQRGGSNGFPQSMF